MTSKFEDFLTLPDAAASKELREELAALFQTFAPREQQDRKKKAGTNFVLAKYFTEVAAIAAYNTVVEVASGECTGMDFGQVLKMMRDMEELLHTKITRGMGELVADNIIGGIVRELKNERKR